MRQCEFNRKAIFEYCAKNKVRSYLKMQEGTQNMKNMLDCGTRVFSPGTQWYRLQLPATPRKLLLPLENITFRKCLYSDKTVTATAVGKCSRSWNTSVPTSNEVPPPELAGFNSKLALSFQKPHIPKTFSPEVTVTETTTALGKCVVSQNT